MEDERVKRLINKVDTQALKQRSLTDWRPILTEECQVYVFGENYIAKRFDAINYKFCDKDTAKEILVDNLYALLRYKYFPVMSDEIDDKISDIIKSFTLNLKTTLKKVSFDKNSDSNVISMIPDYCLAFRNGVYDFLHDKWLFKYDIIRLESLNNTIYMYDNKYAILWYFDYNFSPLDINTQETSLYDFIDIMKELVKTSKNYCFELMYNMSHDEQDKFDIDKFKHLCEILGYCCLNSFSQHFVVLIGSGQNGKNSLFDGCFTNRIIPMAASNDMESIENDRFITGALENKAHNIFLESTTVARTYNESKMLKSLTGSMYQTIESKGVQKYSGIINCKYVFAANDQDKLKFGDTTLGFRRRINMFEISYQWDKEKRFLKKGDYYDTTFSNSLEELKNDSMNTTVFVYFAMYGIILATKNFTRNFEFEYNDWNMRYSDIDMDAKDKIEQVTLEKLVEYMKTTHGSNICKTSIYDSAKTPLYKSKIARNYGVYDYQTLVNMLSNPEDYEAFFSENDIYLSIRLIQTLSGIITTPTSFTQTFKKLYNIRKFEQINANIPHVKCSFVKGKLKIIG